MVVTFYQFAKRENSTKRPGGGQAHNVILKEPSSVLTPSLALQWAGGGSPAAYNYAYIGQYGRYYYVRNWTYQNRQWIVDLVADPLASWKSQIGSSSKYVLRSASSRDLEVIDTAYPATGGETILDLPMSTGLDSDPMSGGCYVLSVTGATNTLSIGGAGYYICTANQLQIIISQAFNAVDSILSNTGGITDVESAITWFGESVVRGTNNIAQFINSVMWVPHSVPHEATAVPVYLGLVNAGTAYPATTAVVTDSFSWDLGTSGIDFTGPIWEWTQPLCYYTLQFMPFGLIPLDSLSIFNNGYVKCEYRFDIVSGVGILKVYTKVFQQEVYNLLTIRSAQLGTQIQLGGSFVNYASALGTVAAAATGVAAAESTADALIAAGSGIGNSIAAIAPDALTVGHAGGIAAVDTTAHLIIRQLAHVPEDVAEQGQPLCKIKTLNTLSGYILCRDGDVQAPATIQELAQIKAYLEGGFYYE